MAETMGRLWPDEADDGATDRNGTKAGNGRTTAEPTVSAKADQPAKAPEPDQPAEATEADQPANAPAAWVPEAGPGTVTGEGAIVLADDGTFRDPATPEEWDEWVSAGRTRNWCLEDPLLDWLGRYGAQNGFARDDETEGYDPRTDMRAFVLARGQAFEDGVMRLIRERFGDEAVLTIRNLPEDVRDLGKARQTFQAMQAGVPVIAQAVLRNPERRTYGAVDLLVRSDYLDRLVPETLGPEQAAVPARALARPGEAKPSWHYRVVDIKFHTFDLVKDGHAASDSLAYHVQVWIYNEALGRIQGYLPPSAFLLGRSWSQGDGRGTGCLDRLARVDHDRARKSDGRSVAQVADEGIGWIRRLRADGERWHVLPEPSVPELYPHMRNIQDQPWHSAKSQIAAQLRELTLLPGMNPRRRGVAFGNGIRRWDDPRANSETLGIGTVDKTVKCDAVLEANRSVGSEAVFPIDRVRHAEPAWRERLPYEFYVDFETVSNLDDDFTALPVLGGLPLIFQIGCGHWEAGQWRFKQWTAETLSEPEEARIIDAWLDHLIEATGGSEPLDARSVRIFHWSPAEPSTLQTAYNAARKRQPGRGWPDTLPWYDFLGKVIREEPVAVRGAFNFGLKSVARAMKAAGLIETDWADSPLDGLGAMVGAWWCSREAAAAGVPMTSFELMREIGRYNEVDCRAMAEVIAWLRANR